MTEFELEEEKKEIVRQYRRLLRHAKPFLQDDDAKIIKRAFNLSQEAHKNMRRRSGEPYIFHPLAVAQICVEEIGLGTTSIVSALLHDVVEDTEMPARLEGVAIDRVGILVVGVVLAALVADQARQVRRHRVPGFGLSGDLKAPLWTASQTSYAHQSPHDRRNKTA